MHQNSCAPRKSHCLWRAHRPHSALYTHDSTWRTRASERRRQRYARNSRTGGYRMTQAQGTQAKHIHVIGIGGSAMAPLAGMLRESGFRVTGCDSGVYPPASTLLDSLGIAYFPSFEAGHLAPAPEL